MARIQNMSDEELAKIWANLGQMTWANDEMYDSQSGTTMNNWAQNIYSEMCIRGLPR